MAHLTINVLGALQVLLDDAPVQPFESDKVRALLAYLVVEADHSHSREALMGLLWPDCAEEAARHNLRQALFNLRLGLGDHTAKPPYLLISRSSIQFNPESDYSLDLAVFNDYFAKWGKKRSQESSSSSTINSQLEEMVDLYRGEFLHHFYIADSAEFEDWIVVQRETSRQQMMGALTHLANQYELLEDYQAARRYAERQLALDPWREEAHYQIMRLLALDGQRSAALAQFESCKKILAAELGVEPSTKTHELYEQIRSGTLKAKDKLASRLPVRAVPSLPLPLTPFFGREQELVDLAQMLADPEYRCITLVGPGGIGKTRLALQVANQQKHLFPDGSAFVALASVESIDAVLATIANAIHFGFSGPTDPKIQLLNYLRDKHMLLIVDNVEHLLVDQRVQGTVAELLMEILQQADGIKLLITSRELINLQGEWIFEVQGLSFPTMKPGDDFDAYSAVALFVQRARRANPGLEMNAEDKASVARLCHLVEGMPLALELAATWVRILPPTEITIEIEKSIDFLNAQMRDLPERHRSIRAVFDHSWKMLSNEEKRVLTRLSIFRGGFQRQAAEKVAGAALPVLSSLVIRSLIRRTATGRYDLHELIHQYAASKLAEDPQELGSAQDCHSSYFLCLLEEQGVRLQSRQQKEAVNELTGDIDNIRAAWDWAVVHQNTDSLVQTSEYLWWLLELHNWFKEGENIFWKTAEAFRKSIQEDNSNQIGLPVAVNMMLAHFGYFRFRQGKSEEAYQILLPCTAFLRASSDLLAATISSWYLGIVCWELGRFEEAKESFQESLRLAQQRGIPWHEAAGSEFVGMVLHEQGDDHRSKQYLSEALALARRIGDPSLTAHMLSYFSQTLTALGEFKEAEEFADESIHLGREIGWRTGTGLALDAMGQLAFAQGKNEEARDHLSESATLFQEVGDTYRLARELVHLGRNFLVCNQINEARDNFITALKMAHEGGYIATILAALTGLAAISIRQIADPQVLELVLFVLQHASSTQETKKIAIQLRDELESRLVQEEIELAQQSAMLKDLDDFVLPFLSQ